MIGGVADAMSRAAVESASRSDVELASQNRLDAGLPPRSIELQRAEHITAIRQAHSRHAILLGHGEKIRGAIGTVEQRIL